MRDKFHQTGPIPVTDIKLDLDNFRFYGQLETQKDCIQRIIEDSPNHFVSMAKDLTVVGLMPLPIIVSMDATGSYVVRDGNRRVTALKCLNNPSLCENKGVRKKLEQILEDHPDGVASEVDCLYCADEEEIFDYMERLHAGLLDGAGQKEWNSENKTSFDIHRGRTTANAFAHALVNWMRQEGVEVSNNFPITTLQRMLGPHVKGLLGMDWDGKTVLCANQVELFKVMQRIIKDLDDGLVKVDDVRTWKLREPYLRNVLKETGVEEASPDKPLSPLVPKPKEKNFTPQPAAKKQSSAKASNPKHRWRRKHLIPNKTIVPAPGTGRVHDVYTELKCGKCMDITMNPNATALLFRTYLEWSVEHYINVYNPTTRGTELKERLWSVTLDLEKRGLINEDQKLVLEQAKINNTMISTTTLNKWVHSEHFNPTPQSLCMFWDEIEFFIAACWK